MFRRDIQKFSEIVMSVSKALFEADVTGRGDFDTGSYDLEALAVVSRLYITNMRYVTVEDADHALRETFSYFYFPELVELISWKSLATSTSDRYNNIVNDGCTV